MSDTPKSKTKSTSKTEAKSSESSSTGTSTESDSAKSTDSTPSTANEGGKSSRESIGGAGAVHYGYFSNVKTPKYRSGWDDIWSNESEPKKKETVRAKEPVVISLAIDDLPADVQESLAAIARAKLKKSRINYDNRAKANAIAWRIDCEVKR